MDISIEEKSELERFKKRRTAFYGNLSVKNVHNVPTLFPNMYRRIFSTDTLISDMFCLHRPSYSDADDEVVKLYEDYLKEP